MIGVAAYPLYGLRRLRAPMPQEHTQSHNGYPGSAATRKLRKTRYTVTTGVSGLAGCRYRFADMAHLVRGCCEWYWIVLQAS
eukprot:161289-Rhodomonas_salina.1